MAASGGGDQVEVNLTPLLDLVLQLIMFFMITISLVHYEVSNEDINLPHLQLSTPQETEKKNKFPVWVNLDYKGRIIGLGTTAIKIPVPDDPVYELDSKRDFKEDLEKVRQQIKAYFKEKKEEIRRPARLMGLAEDEYKVGVVIRADRRCRYLPVWTLMDVVRKEAEYDFWQVSYLSVGG
jgi:biopolymer transport protein ExbD